jgi:peptide/nickel transport system permease protein
LFLSHAYVNCYDSNIIGWGLIAPADRKGGVRTLIRYTIRRILLLIPVILIVSLLVFLLLDLAPGTVVDAMDVGHLTQEQLDELISSLGLDRSVFYRYGMYMLNLFQGDLGTSDFIGVDVWEIYMARLPNTLLLAVTSILFGASIGIPLGIFAAKRSGTLADSATTFVTLIGLSIPAFWLGLMLMLQFSLRWELLPAGGFDGITSLIMPTSCSGFALMATSCRQTRSSMLEQLKADFLRTARAKGVPENVVINKHALTNAMIPILQTLGNALSFAISGSAIIETVFTWRGVGQLAVDAVINRDVTLTMGTTLLTSVMFVSIQLLVDLSFAFVDPRIKSRFARPKVRKIREVTA